jgi:uncharacterized integral membrane protein
VLVNEPDDQDGARGEPSSRRDRGGDEPSRGGDEPSGRGDKVRREYAGVGFVGGVVALIVLGLLLVVLIIQNAEAVEFSVLWWSAEVPLAALLLATAVISIAVAELVGVLWRRRRRAIKTLVERAAG